MKLSFSSQLWRGFMHVLSGNALATIAQGLQFFLLARVLGPSEFGQVGTASAIAVLLLPYSGMGAANVMIMRSTRDPAVLPLYFGNALIVMGLTGSLLTAFAALVVAPLIGSGFDPVFMFIFGASELLAAKIVDICWQVFVARDEMRSVSLLLATHSLGRLVTAVLFATLSQEHVARAWGSFALVSNIVVGLGILWWTRRIVGRLRCDIRLAVRETRAGAAFAVGLSAKGFYTDADKVFLARFTNPAVVATYTMACRVVLVALVPARALSFSLSARMFRAGERGLTGTLAMTRRLLLPSIALGAVISATCFVTAPLLPLIAGEKYLASVEILRVLSLLPIVVAMQSLLADTLSSSGYHRASAICQLVAGIMISVLSIMVIPGMGWRGAGLASYSSQIFLSIMLATVIWYSWRSERDSRLESEPAEATPPRTAVVADSSRSAVD